MNWLILRDMDHDADCAAQLMQSLVNKSHPQFCLRIAVREAESWLMADHASLADFLHVSAIRMPERPDTLESPKSQLVALARKSRDRNVRLALIPSEGSGIKTGPEYSAWMVDYAATHWDVGRAVKSGRSPSLGRAIARLRTLAQ